MRYFLTVRKDKANFFQRVKSKTPVPFGPEIAYSVDFIRFMFTKCQNRKPFNYNKLSDFRESLRNVCLPYAFFEGKEAWETRARKGTSRTLKEIRQQYPKVL